MRKLIGLLSAAALVLTLVVPVSGAQAERFYFKGGNALAAARAEGVQTAFEFANGFTANMSPVAAQRLADKFGLSYEAVGTVTTLGKKVEATAKPTPGGRALPEDPTPWGIENIHNNQSITSTSGGAGVIVAVLDTGVASHIDLKAPLQCKNFSSRRGGVQDGSCADGDGHGTHVTGTILANGGSDGKGIWGVAPQADYFAYKVLNDQGSGTYDAIAAAIQMAADNGADIISMSLGGSSAPEYVRDAIIYANSKGTLVIAAAGNSGPSANTIGYPGAFAEAVAVAALEMISGATGSGDSTSLSNLRVSSYSSRGIATSSGSDGIQDREVEISGPGTYVESTSNTGGYVKYSGTSMATPHMSGLAALIWTNASSTRSALVNRAQQYDITQANGGGAGTGYDYASGYGAPRN